MDAYSHCEALVREADKDRFLSALFAPAAKRGALHALYAFDIEVTQVRSRVREPMAGEIRLQWWREVIEGQRAEEAGANPVAAALLDTIRHYALSRGELMELTEARSFDLYDDTMASLTAFEGYAVKTRGAILRAASRILGAALPEDLVHDVSVAGEADAVVVAQPARQRYVPPEMTVAGLARLAEDRLSHAASREFPSVAIPAVLTAALLRPALKRGGELPQWRRQWLLWRAARNPLRPFC